MLRNFQVGQGPAPHTALYKTPSNHQQQAIEPAACSTEPGMRLRVGTKTDDLKTDLLQLAEAAGRDAHSSYRGCVAPTTATPLTHTTQQRSARTIQHNNFLIFNLGAQMGQKPLGTAVPSLARRDIRKVYSPPTRNQCSCLAQFGVPDHKPNS